MTAEGEFNKTLSNHTSKKYLLVWLLTIVATYTVLLIISQFISVKNISIEGATEVRGIDSYFGKNMLMLSTTDMATLLKSDNPKLQNVIIRKSYPHSLTIVATLKHPSVMLKLADGYILLAADGYILQKSKENLDSHVPLIHYYQPLFYNHYSVGELFENNDIQTVTHVSRSMMDSGVRVSSIDIASENMIVLHTEEFDVFITSEKDADKQFSEFEYTYKKLKIEGMKFSSIDVRFEKPIIKLS